MKDTLHNKANLTVSRKHLGMCFGVRDATTLAKRVVKSRPLTVLGELVRNATVLDDLRGEGVQFETLASDVKTETVMITAHGASNRTKVRARESGLKSGMQPACWCIMHTNRFANWSGTISPGRDWSPRARGGARPYRGLVGARCGVERT